MKEEKEQKPKRKYTRKPKEGVEVSEKDKTTKNNKTIIGEESLIKLVTDENNNVEKEKIKNAKCKDYSYSLKALILTCIMSVLITIIVFIILIVCFKGTFIINNTKLEKDVTITDEGIADAVEKIYDSVVVVETFQNDQPYASGTGFVFKKEKGNGYILTNYHVIANSNKVTVTFTNNEKVEATVVGSDDYSDIAVLKVDDKHIKQVAETAKSEDMRVGDTTFAVGAPIDSTVYSWSVTRGVLSGKNRLVEVQSTNSNNTVIMKVLQTDTAINSGNSGGPLCNSNGEVIGITNMKLASSQVEGMGFAIPIEDALSYAKNIIDGKPIIRPYLGISMYDASANFFSQVTGLFIQEVVKGSPADKAGLKSGDKVLKINDVKVDNSSYFKYELYKYSIGDKITITVERNGKEKEIKVTLGSNAEIN